ncbi:MAG: PDZ domain-containing protein [Miltoncostaeaceae bacterium]
MSRLITRTAITLAAITAGAAAGSAMSAPAVESLRLPKTIASQQGHARFLVGVRLTEEARLTVRVVDAADDSVMKTITDQRPRPAGRAYMRIEATDDLGYQLEPGAYRLRIQAVSPSGESSEELRGAFRLRLTPPHALFDLFAVPMMRPLRASIGVGARVKGMYVAVVGPGGVLATAGLRRGDIVTSIGGTAVDTPGAYATALRALKADEPVAVEYLRDGETTTVEVTLKPDWEPVPDYAASLAVATRREPRSLALAYAQVRERVIAEEFGEARDMLREWPAGWRRSAAGQLLIADMLAGEDRWKPALGAYNRARRGNPTHAQIQLGRGIAVIELGKPRRAFGVLAAGARLDPKDAEIAGYQSYALLRARLPEKAVGAAQRAVRLDRFYPDGYIPLGISLLGQDQRRPGVQALRRGLILVDDADRAQRLISAYLNPTDP